MDYKFYTMECRTWGFHKCANHSVKSDYNIMIQVELTVASNFPGKRNISNHYFCSSKINFMQCWSVMQLRLKFVTNQKFPTIPWSVKIRSAWSDVLHEHSWDYFNTVWMKYDNLVVSRINRSGGNIWIINCTMECRTWDKSNFGWLSSWSTESGSCEWFESEKAGVNVLYWT